MISPDIVIIGSGIGGATIANSPVANFSVSQARMKALQLLRGP